MRNVCKKARKAARRCANDYWTKLSEEVQQAAETGNIRGMYEWIRKATGPTSKKTAPLKDKEGNVITDKTEQMN